MHSRQHNGSQFGERLASGLGWFSIALGVPSLVAPESVERLIGVRSTEGTRAVVRGIGVQEIGVGAGLVKRSSPVALQWSRVIGDLGHLGLLAGALASNDSDERRVRNTMAAIGGITAIDLFAALRLTRESSDSARAGAITASTAITVKKPTAEVYSFWRDFENLPEFMYHLESVRTTGERRSHWVARAPAGKAVEWDAEITEDRPNELIAWRSAEGARVPNVGSVRFSPAPRGQGTEIFVEIEYAPPGGRIGAAVAKLFGEEPEQQIRDDLRRFKQVMETGEVVVSAAIPDGTRTQRQFHHKQRPAQPAARKGK